MSLDISRIRALCFDVDGTLSDSDDLFVARLALTLRRLRVTDQPELLARRLVMGLESPSNFVMGLADRLTIDDEIIGLVSWLNRHWNRAAPPAPPIPGVPAMLEQLRRRFPMAIVSARDEVSTLAFLDHSSLREHFHVIVSALSTQRAKPFPDPLIHAARLLGVEPHSCLMIGDTTVDIRSGRAAGAQTVGVLCGFGQRDELARHGADIILESTADLTALLTPE